MVTYESKKNNYIRWIRLHWRTLHRFFNKKGCEKIYVADIVENKNLSKLSEVTYINCDVRKKIDIELLENIDAIFNFAAIHREPGHEGFEYFETNINGAKIYAICS